MRDRSVDGLRGIAAVSVMFSHFLTASSPFLLTSYYGEWLEFNPHTFSTVDRLFSFPLVSVFYNGLFAVQIFFVLSGFVLVNPGIINDRHRVITRFISRPLRLGLPILIVSLVSYVIFLLGGYFNIPAGEATGSRWLSTSIGTNIPIVQGIPLVLYEGMIFGKGDIVPQLWTLRVEFWGSMALLCVAVLSGRRYALVGLAALLAGCLSLSGPDWHFFIAFPLGAALGFLPRSGKVMAASLFVLGLFLGGFLDGHWLYYLFPSPFENNRAVYSLVGAVLLVQSVRSGVFSRLFQSNVVQLFGKLSFGIYLIHFTIVSTLWSWLYLNYATNTLIVFFITAFSMIIVLLLSAVFEKYCDRPSINLGNAFANAVLRMRNVKGKSVEIAT